MAAVSKDFREIAQVVSDRISRRAVYVSGYCALLVITAYSAIIVKESRQALPLLAVEAVKINDGKISPVETPELIGPVGILGPGEFGPPAIFETEPPSSVVPVVLHTTIPAASAPASTPKISRNMRWFNGRPVKPARTILMVVTGYSPDARSCGDSADGLTATMHSVETNAFQLVAADPTVLPYGSMLSIPGYAENLIVPVLDCGSKIKGNRIDLLFKTHEQAMKWGVKHLAVTVWEYADGEPAENPRKLR